MGRRMFNEYPYINYSDFNMDWIINNAKEINKRIDALEGWETEHKREYDELKRILESIYSGDLSPALIRALEDWMNNNGVALLAKLVKMVFFGLTESGYFCAYIPESWDDITFNTTGWDIEIPEIINDYGHLVLSY